MFYLLMPSLKQRSAFIEHMKSHGISTPFHYVPLHSSPAGKRYGRASGDLPITNRVSDTLVRLPLYFDLQDEMIDTVHQVAERFFKQQS